MNNASKARFPEPDVALRVDARGVHYLQNALPLPPYAGSLLERLEHWARLTPDQPYLCEREGSGWRQLSYAEALAAVDRIAGKLLAMGVSPAAPLMTVAANGIDHALVLLAGMRIGVPVAVIQPAYANGGDGEKLAAVAAQVRPGAILLGEPQRQGATMARVKGAAVLFSSRPEPAHEVAGLEALPSAPAEAVARAAAQVSPDAPAKLLFTSGSTGRPKGVINTQRMMCSNMAALSATWPFLADIPPRLVDWLPWCHTFGGNCCFNLVLYYGGTLFIDDGKPAPRQIERTVENLWLARPNLYFNVPIGYEALLPFLESDPAFADQVFGDLIFLFNAGAAMPAHTRARLQAATEAVGLAPPILGAWGSTETAPFSTVVYFDTPFADNLGVPLPGTIIKMVPNSGKYELRVKGPNVAPAYWSDPAATAQAFDEEGYFRIGDAGQLADTARPQAGLRFDGRTAENFKLTSGTWVNAGGLRLKVIEAAAPWILDLVVTGHDRDQVGVLVFLNPGACRTALGVDMTLDEAADHPEVIAAIRAALADLNRAHGVGGSMRVARFAILLEPPKPDHGEITDKGSLNQRAILDRRRHEVERLYGSGHLVED